MNYVEVASRLQEWGEPKFRLAQIKQAYCIDFLSGWDQVTTLGKELRDRCAEELAWDELFIVRTQESSDGETVKFLLQAKDGSKIETVLMQHEGNRNTVCVSSQVGCAMGCLFCATGTMGWKRQLTSEEIVNQVIHVARYLKIKGERLSNVVFMGMGEPMHNYDEVIKAVHEMNDQKGLCIGARKISISTCGVVPGILRFADEPTQANLAISLHGATNEVRNKIMPINKAYPLEKLIPAVRLYMEKTNRKVMFEYLLLEGINDRREDAEHLAGLFGDDLRLVHINLIKYHDTKAFKGSSTERRMQFLDWLHKLYVPVTHRVSFGEDIDAACGQLAVNESERGTLQGKEAISANKQQS